MKSTFVVVKQKHFENLLTDLYIVDLSLAGVRICAANQRICKIRRLVPYVEHLIVIGFFYGRTSKFPCFQWNHASMQHYYGVDSFAQVIMADH